MDKARKRPKKMQPLATEGFAERLFQAWLTLAARMGRMPKQNEVGELVGKRLNRAPFHQSTVSDWQKGAIPDVQTIAAIAQVCGVDPGWLAFGDLSKAPRPDSVPPAGG